MDEMEFLQLMRQMANSDVETTPNFKTMVRMRNVLLKNFDLAIINREKLHNLINQIISAIDIDVDESFTDNPLLFHEATSLYAKLLFNVWKAITKEFNHDVFIKKCKGMNFTYKGAS